ncbi:hypothetical protein EJD97_005256 [Solanum chilense]|uniref:DUF1985 domain-containing protein n=1 Tax=Solanum chilense TaxID=4083 RepID=A0A6N2BSU8_SOLCI|nr:hypothetical protein EJD97_005256 [Solanum chilense]
MEILYFINTFMLCHLGETFILIEEFLMVEDGRYELYPWGQIAFNKLITSLEQDFNQSKQMYRLFDFVVKVANDIPRICNWTVVAEKPKYEKFMSSIFSELLKKKCKLKLSQVLRISKQALLVIY